MFEPIQNSPLVGCTVHTGSDKQWVKKDPEFSHDLKEQGLEHAGYDEREQEERGLKKIGIIVAVGVISTEPTSQRNSRRVFGLLVITPKGNLVECVAHGKKIVLDGKFVGDELYRGLPLEETG
jgi:hypothetical protein